MIVTKVTGYSERMTWIPANRTDPPGEEAVCRLDYDSIRAAVDGSLRRLGVDYIDILYIHWPDR